MVTGHEVGGILVHAWQPISSDLGAQLCLTVYNSLRSLQSMLGGVQKCPQTCRPQPVQGAYEPLSQRVNVYTVHYQSKLDHLQKTMQLRSVPPQAS